MFRFEPLDYDGSNSKRVVKPPPDDEDGVSSAYHPCCFQRAPDRRVSTIFSRHDDLLRAPLPHTDTRKVPPGSGSIPSIAGSAARNLYSNGQNLEPHPKL